MLKDRDGNVYTDEELFVLMHEMDKERERFNTFNYIMELMLTYSIVIIGIITMIDIGVGMLGTEDIFNWICLIVLCIMVVIGIVIIVSYMRICDKDSK